MRWWSAGIIPWIPPTTRIVASSVGMLTRRLTRTQRRSRRGEVDRTLVDLE